MVMSYRDRLIKKARPEQLKYWNFDGPTESIDDRVPVDPDATVKSEGGRFSRLAANGVTIVVSQ